MSVLNYKDDNHNLQIKKTMNNKNDNIIILDNEDRIAMRSRMYKLGNYIYENFKDLINYKNLNHSQNEINRLLMSQNVILFLYLVDNKIEGYLVCETTGCNVLFINYIYVVNKYRGHKIGSQLMSSAMEYAKKINIRNIDLISEIDSVAYNWYKSLGFMKNNDVNVGDKKHLMLSLNLNNRRYK